MNFSDEPLPPPAKTPRLALLIGILAAAAVVLAAVSVLRVFDTTPPAAMGSRHPAVGMKLTELTFQPLLRTEEETTSASLQGKVALVNFWGTWCPPCRVELPHMIALEKELRGQPDFRFISVSVQNRRDADETAVKEPTEKYLAELKATFPVYIDPSAQSRRHLLKAGKISADEFGYPATVLLGRDGIIRGVWFGFVPGWEEEIATAVKGELAKK